MSHSTVYLWEQSPVIQWGASISRCGCKQLSSFLIPQFLLINSLVTNTRYFLSSDTLNLLVKKKSVKQSLSKTSNLAVIFVFFPRRNWCLEKAASLAHVMVQVVWPKKCHQVKSVTTPCSRSVLFFLLSCDNQQDIIQRQTY